MPDQLTFRLDTDLLPDLPDLRPMEPRLLPEPFDSDEHLFEPWWGGVRAFAYIGPAMQPGDGTVRIVGAEGEDLSAALPELAGMAVRVAARSAILDGRARIPAIPMNFVIVFPKAPLTPSTTSSAPMARPYPVSKSPIRSTSQAGVTIVTSRPSA